MAASALTELLGTEVAYVNDLQLVCDSFVRPLRVLGKEALEIFSNIETIRGINTALLHDMLAPVSVGVWHLLQEHDLPSVAQVAAALEKFSPFLLMYSQYCADFTGAQTRLAEMRSDSTSDIAMRLAEAERTTRRDLHSLLIKPVQRLCKYPLLLREMLKVVEPSDPAHASLCRAAAAVEGVAFTVNERVRDMQGLAALRQLATAVNMPQLVTPTRTLMATVECALNEAAADPSQGSARREGRLWLCNDLLLIGKRSGAAGGGGGGSGSAGGADGDRSPFEVIALSPLHLASLDTIGLSGDGQQMLRVSLLSSPSSPAPQDVSHHRMTLPSASAAVGFVAQLTELQRKAATAREQQLRAQALRAQQDPTLSKLTSLRRQRRSDRAAARDSAGSSRARSSAGVSSLDRARARNSSMRAHSLSHDLDADWGVQPGVDDANWLVAVHEDAQRSSAGAGASKTAEESATMLEASLPQTLHVLHQLAGLQPPAGVRRGSGGGSASTYGPRGRRSLGARSSLATVPDEPSPEPTSEAVDAPVLPPPPPPPALMRRRSSSSASVGSGGGLSPKAVFDQVDKLTLRVRSLSAEGTVLAEALAGSPRGSSEADAGPATSYQALLAAWQARQRRQ